MSFSLPGVWIFQQKNMCSVSIVSDIVIVIKLEHKTLGCGHIVFSS